MASKNKPHSNISFDVVSGLAKELDAPLRSLLQSSQRLISDYQSRNFEYVSYKDFKKILTTLEHMNRQLARCAHTTQAMLSLGQKRVPAGNELASVDEEIRRILSLLDRQLRSAHIKITVVSGKNIPPVGMSKVDCHQVVHNLLVNAIQAMPAGGKITVRTGWNKAEGMVTIDIDDEGIGIPPEHLTKVFEPFFTTKERGVEKSSGFGLSIVYSIVHSIGGDIHIQSSLRKGTMVRVTLPAASASLA